MITPSEADLLAAFADFLRLDVAQGDASPETIRAYAGQVHAFVTWCQAQAIRPAAASEVDLKAYRATLVAGGYARSAIAARLNAVRRFYAMAQARGCRFDNPAQGVKAPPDRADRAERIKWLPLTAVSGLLAAPDARALKGKRDRAILALLALHGLRVAEVVALQMDDLDLMEPPLGALSVPGKGKKRRRVLLVETSRVALEAWLGVRSQAAVESEGALFVSLQRNGGRGTALDRRGARRMVDGYLVELGLKRPRTSCHALRHSFATLSRAAGARLDAISRAMGHSNIATTQVYAQIVDAAAENPARFLVGALEAIEK
jgi:integrase/recombinase XerD